ncbi:hypothetical protein B0A52_05714 [Exophiala mesophila]|uniref:Uncharacterized protein n=1 Tax=Exophiala mesophila TaxID=212818 RepID=A0A438N2B8_EXOME|nr:hypothetical protein B0A52_05714 [Exophiala mesophila]
MATTQTSPVRRSGRAPSQHPHSEVARPKAWKSSRADNPWIKKWLRAAERGELGKKNIGTRHVAFYSKAQYNFDAVVIKGTSPNTMSLHTHSIPPPLRGLPESDPHSAPQRMMTHPEPYHWEYNSEQAG